MKIGKIQWFAVSTGLVLLLLLSVAGNSRGYNFVLPDTDQSLCYDTLDTVSPPGEGESFYGQDAQYNSSPPEYSDNGDGTVTDVNTGLM